jgi:sec-independent protein translocase protein TatB
MFNIGMSEFIVLGAIALIFIGPKQLPEVARTVGRLLNEMKRVSEEVFGSFSDIKNSTRRFMDETEKQVNQNINPIEPDLPPITPGQHGQTRPYNFLSEEDELTAKKLTEETTAAATQKTDAEDSDGKS